MAFDTRRANRYAVAFVASGGLLGALCGWAWDAIRHRNPNRRSSHGRYS